MVEFIYFFYLSR